MSTRAQALAERIEQGAAELIAFAKSLSEAEWETGGQSDERPAGVVIHHVASGYLAEAGAIQMLASGQAMAGITIEMIHQGNAEHAEQNASPGKDETLDLLRRNSAQAAEIVRGLSDEQLDWAAPNSLHAGAPLTTQYFIEQHPILHSYHHLAKIRAAIQAEASA